MCRTKRIVGTPSRDAREHRSVAGSANAVFVTRQSPGPGVEELHGARTVGDLSPKERDGDLRESLQERSKSSGSVCIKVFDARELSVDRFDQIVAT